MSSSDQTKEQILEKNLELRRRVGELEEALASGGPRVLSAHPHLLQTLLDSLPPVAMLLRPGTREIVACNQAGKDVGATPGKTCFETWGQSDQPCPWCQAPKVWETGKAVHTQPEGAGRLWDAHWIPVGEDLYLHYAYDITEQAQTQHALKESEERFKTFADASFEGIIVTEKGRFVDANDRFLKLFGYELDELLGTEVSNLVASEDREMVMERILSGCGEPYEHKALHKDGSTIDVEVCGRSTHYRGHPCRITALREISVQKRAERAQELSRAVLEVLGTSVDTRDLIDNLLPLVRDFAGVEALGIRLRDGEDFPYYEVRGFPPDFVAAERTLCVRDQEGAILRDAEGEAILECMCGNVIRGRVDPALPFFTDGGSFWTDSTSDLLASTTEQDRQGRTRNRCNKQGYESVALVPLRSGGEIIGLLQLNDSRRGRFTLEAIRLLEGLGTTIGIALSRKRAEEELRASKERFRRMADTIPNVFWLADTETHKIIYISPAYEKIWGRPVDALYRDARSWLESIHPDDRERIAAREQAGDSVDKSTTQEHYEYRILRPDGAVRWIGAREFAIGDESGRTTMICGVAEDITGRRKLEEQLRQSQKLEAIGQLAGGIAHDFNNLLQSILGYSNILKMQAAPGSMTYRAAEVTEKAAVRASDLTKQLLGFARKGKLQNVPVDMHRIVHDTVSIIGRTVDKRIEISLRLEADPSVVLGDPSQIEQVVMNLAMNARDAMPEGGELLVETSNIELDDDYCREHAETTPGRYLLVNVSDTGAGMTDEVRARVFEPFFTTKERGKGTGMGLAMVYGIVKNHGGTVNVYSTPGTGATFKIYLPLARNAERAKDTQELKALVRGSGTILVADDEESVRQICMDMLTALGYKVLLVKDGSEAVRCYGERGDSIDLVILDMSMPVMDGCECFRKLKEIDPGVKVVVSTGHALNGAAQEIMNEGASRFLQKPFVLAQLSEAVAKALHGDSAEDVPREARSEDDDGAPQADTDELRHDSLEALAEMLQDLLRLKAVLPGDDEAAESIETMIGRLREIIDRGVAGAVRGPDGALSVSKGAVENQMWHSFGNLVGGIRYFVAGLLGKQEEGDAVPEAVRAVEDSARRAMELVARWREASRGNGTR